MKFKAIKRPERIEVKRTVKMLPMPDETESLSDDNLNLPTGVSQESQREVKLEKVYQPLQPKVIVGNMGQHQRTNSLKD